MKKTGTWLVYISLIVILVGVALPLIYGPQSMAYKYIFATGSGLLLIGRLLTPYRGPYIRVKRLTRILVWSALFFCVGAFFMFYSSNPKDWLAFVLAGALVQLYVSIVTPRAIRQSQKNGK